MKVAADDNVLVSERVAWKYIKKVIEQDSLLYTEMNNKESASGQLSSNIIKSGELEKTLGEDANNLTRKDRCPYDATTTPALSIVTD